MSETKKDILEPLGRRIRALRRAQGLSQCRLADSAGMSQRYLSEVEAGKRNVSVVFLDALARQLSVPLTELLEDTEPRARDTVLQDLRGLLDRLSLDELLFLRRAMRILKAKDAETD